jgi:hypothetical protein
MNCLVDLTKDPYCFAFVYYVVLVISEELKGYFREEAGKPRVPIKIPWHVRVITDTKASRSCHGVPMPPKPAPPRYFLFRGVD